MKYRIYLSVPWNTDPDWKSNSYRSGWDRCADVFAEYGISSKDFEYVGLAGIQFKQCAIDILVLICIADLTEEDLLAMKLRGAIDRAELIGIWKYIDSVRKFFKRW